MQYIYKNLEHSLLKYSYFQTINKNSVQFKMIQDFCIWWMEFLMIYLWRAGEFAKKNVLTVKYYYFKIES